MSSKKATVLHNPLEGERPELCFNLHDGSEEQVSIVIIHKDQAPYLSLLVQSISVTSSSNNYEIIVVDNGSGPESQDFLKELEQDGIRIVRNDKNLYWAAAANRGAAAASKASKYILFMHSDVIITNPAWMDLLINVSESQGSGLVGLELQCYYMQKQKVDFVREWCMLVTRQCWQDTGPFPEELPQIGTSFVFTFKAQQNGYKPQIMRNPVCHHYGVFGLSTSEHERLVEEAMKVIPELIRKVQKPIASRV